MRFASTQSVNDDCIMERTGAAGTCVLLQNCASALMEIVQQSSYPTRCGFQNSDQIVCCPKPPIQKPTHLPALRISEHSKWKWIQIHNVQQTMSCLTNRTNSSHNTECIEYQEPVYERVFISNGFNSKPIEKKIFRCAIANVPLIVGGEGLFYLLLTHFLFVHFRKINVFVRVFDSVQTKRISAYGKYIVPHQIRFQNR